MTGRERLLTALHGGIPDAVPVTSFIVDQGHFLSQMYSDLDPFAFPGNQNKVIEIQKQFGMDVMVRIGVGITNGLLFMHKGGVNTEIESENWEVKKERRSNGNVTAESSRIRTPAGELTQEFSYTEISPNTFLYACTKKPIQTEADLSIAEQYEPLMPEAWQREITRRIGLIKDQVGEDGIVGVWMPHGPFNTASLVFPHDQLYMLFLTEPEFYGRLMRFALKRSRPYAAAIEAAGPDVQFVAGNVAGGFVGKRLYDEHILPYEKEYVAFLQANGTPAMYHNCGEIMNLVESYIDLKIAAVEPFSPPPLGDCNDLSRVKALVEGGYSILSGIDQVNTLKAGTPEAVKRATEERMKAGKPGGGFIMQPVDFLEYETPEENIAAYVEVAREHSVY